MFFDDWVHEHRVENAYFEGVRAGEDAADDAEIQDSYDRGFDEGFNGEE